MAISPLVIKDNISLSTVSYYEREIDRVILSNVGNPTINANSNAFKIGSLHKKINELNLAEVDYLRELYLKAGWKTFTFTEHKDSYRFELVWQKT